MPQLSLFDTADEKKTVEEKQAEETIVTAATETAVQENAEQIEQTEQEKVTVNHLPDEEPQDAVEKPETLPTHASNLFFETDEVAETDPSLQVQEQTQINTAVKKTEPIKKRGRKALKEMDAELDLVEVPEDEVLFTKQYYPISLVAKWFRVNSSLLRYWTQEFDILQPRTNKKGDRLFRPEDVKNLQVIYYLLRHRKFTMEGAKTFLKANRKAVDVNMQLMQSLTKFRSFLLELKANLVKVSK